MVNTCESPSRTHQLISIQFRFGDQGFRFDFDSMGPGPFGSRRLAFGTKPIWPRPSPIRARAHIGLAEFRCRFDLLPVTVKLCAASKSDCSRSSRKSITNTHLIIHICPIPNFQMSMTLDFIFHLGLSGTYIYTSMINLFYVGALRQLSGDF